LLPRRSNHVQLIIKSGAFSPMKFLTVASFRSFCAFIAGALSFAVPSVHAQLITQAQAYSLAGTSAVTSVTFNQWNPSGGSLTNVSLTIAGAVSGTFEVFNTTGTNLTVSNARTQQTFTFPGVDAPPALFTTNAMLLQTFPATVPFYAVIDGFDSQVFVLTNNMPLALSDTYDLTDYASYFTGTGTVTLNIFSSFNISGDGPRTFDRSGLTTAGTATLSMVPEPSTYALLMAGCLVAGLAMWRRRRS